MWRNQGSFAKTPIVESEMQKDYLNDALAMIMGLAPDSLVDSQRIATYQKSVDLYGLVHSRYISTTSQGMFLIRERYLRGEFGLCPCCQSNVLPIGLSVQLSHSKVKVYCPTCEDVYVP